MRTRVYSKLSRYQTKQWWWENIDNPKQSHGPFPTRDDARDAAGAARITAKAKAEGREISPAFNTLLAG